MKSLLWLLVGFGLIVASMAMPEAEPNPEADPHRGGGGWGGGGGGWGGGGGGWGGGGRGGGGWGGGGRGGGGWGGREGGGWGR